MQEAFSRRRLPHWDLPGATYFITTCLADSIPAQGLLELARLRRQLAGRPSPQGAPSTDSPADQWKRVFARLEDWLDHRPATRLLADPAAARIVVQTLRHFENDRYDLIAWCVMPSHLHWIFRPRDEWVASLGPAADNRSPRRRIQTSVNNWTARECNRILGRRGQFWQWESYDHCVRDEDELERIVNYIHANPVVAGLVDQPEHYPFSSAATHRRQARGC